MERPILMFLFIQKEARNAFSLKAQMLCACTSQEGIAGITVSDGIYCGNLPTRKGFGMLH
jgi:hypothetical protein